MRRLSPKEYARRLEKARPSLQLLEDYCKASVPLAVRCRRCNTTFSREANAHLRFNCPHCPRGKTDD